MLTKDDRAAHRRCRVESNTRLDLVGELSGLCSDDRGCLVDQLDEWEALLRKQVEALDRWVGQGCDRSEINAFRWHIRSALGESDDK